LAAGGSGSGGVPLLTTESEDLLTVVMHELGHVLFSRTSFVRWRQKGNYEIRGA
jgi:hypothetical protein